MLHKRILKYPIMTGRNTFGKTKTCFRGELGSISFLSRSLPCMRLAMLVGTPGFPLAILPMSRKVAEQNEYIMPSPGHRRSIAGSILYEADLLHTLI
jgi:hypothetical protein